jgi:mannose-1-phosphate guanylyltransferase
MSLEKIRQAVIMVGGKGTRLRPLTETRPKPVLPVLDKPCLMYLIESMVNAGIDDVILACGYKSEKLVAEIGNGEEFGISISYSYEDEPLGTAGAIKLIEDRLDDTFIAANGDVFADIDISKEIDIHRRTKATVTLALTPVENPCEFGIARIEDDGRISEFREKPRPEEVFSNLINAGVYVVEKRVMKEVPYRKAFDLSKELIPILMSRGERIQSYRLEGSWRDVGRPSDLLGANLDMAVKGYSDREWRGAFSDSVIEKPFYAGEGVIMKQSQAESSVILKGSKVLHSNLKDTLVMWNCDIDSSEIIGSILGEGCVVGEGSVIIDSVLGDGTSVKPNSRIRGNMIG